MKKIVPFQKELMFKNKIGEITSIALDNTLKLNDDLVSGEFIVSGTVKMFEGSQIEEEFKYNIPVDITIDSKYDTTKCNISIDDFSYEIINESILKVNISVMLDDLDIKDLEINPVEINLNEEETLKLREDNVKDMEDTIDANFTIDNSIIDNINLKEDIKDNYNEKDVAIPNYEKELFENVEDTKEYCIYRVYTVKEDDTLDIIYEKFNTNKETLMDYNDLDNIGVGSKIIIPSQDE